MQIATVMKVVAMYLNEQSTPFHICGVAKRVLGGRLDAQPKHTLETTGLPWRIDCDVDVKRFLSESSRLNMLKAGRES